MRYPVGKFEKESLPPRESLIADIRELPAKLAAAVEGLSAEQLDMPYREGGWSLRQTVHHVADSHLNAFLRFKFALTEDFPEIRPYDQGKWAETAENSLPVEVSLKLLDGLHHRWASLLESMSDEDFARPLLHPESGKWTLGEMLGLYSWHSRHHTAHVTTSRARNGW